MINSTVSFNMRNRQKDRDKIALNDETLTHVVMVFFFVRSPAPHPLVTLKKM